MYLSYIYPFNGGNVMVTVTNLPVGQYDFYIYGFDGNYQMAVGDVNYGTKTTQDSPVINPPVWQEGKQYALFHSVAVTNSGQAVVITVRPGLGHYAVISGMQILPSIPTNPPATGSNAVATVSQNSMLSSMSHQLTFATVNQGKSMRLTFNGIPECAYQIEYTEDLSHPVWKTLTTQTADSFGICQITDSPLTNVPVRFYRIIQP